MRRYFILLCLMIFYCCEPINKSRKNFLHDKVIENMRDSIIYSGDIESYDKLVRIYSEEDHLGELLPYSIIMASKYQYADAYYDVFYNLINLEGGISDFEINSINKDIRDIALAYFRKAIWKGHFAASRIMIDYYDETGLSPVKELYLDQKLLKKAKNNLVRGNGTN